MSSSSEVKYSMICWSLNVSIQNLVACVFHAVGVYHYFVVIIVHIIIVRNLLIWQQLLFGFWWVVVGIGWMGHIILWDGTSRLSRHNSFVCSMQIVSSEHVVMGPSHNWIAILSVHIPWIAVVIMICVISAIEAIDSVVVLLEWVCVNIEWHSKSWGVTVLFMSAVLRSVTMFPSLFP